MNKKALLLLPLALVLLSACAGDKGPPRICPQVAILRDLERVEDYGSDTIDPSNLVAVAGMKRVEGTCDYEDEGVQVNFVLSMVSEKGPRLGGDQISLPYFVSLVDPDGTVLTKETLSAQFVYPSGGTLAELEEPMHVFIPLAEEGADASFFRVLIGFQLSPEQLKAARAKRGG